MPSYVLRLTNYLLQGCRTGALSTFKRQPTAAADLPRWSSSPQQASGPSTVDHLAGTTLNEMSDSMILEPFDSLFLDFPLGDDQEFW